MRHQESKSLERRSEAGVRGVLHRAATIILATTAVWLALSAAALAQEDSVGGSGEVESQPFTVDARSGSSGENPTGSLFFALRAGTLSGNVTCLFVQNAHEAVIGG